MHTEDSGDADYNGIGRVDVSKIDPGGPGDELNEFISLRMRLFLDNKDSFSYI